MKKIILLTFFVLISGLVFSAKKKKPSMLVVLKAWQTEKPAPYYNGRIYEFEVECKKDNIIIDSVWFGNAPVPCDVWKVDRTNKATQCQAGQKYSVSCNRDLYYYFPEKFDSTNTVKTFKAPTTFSGEAYILYRYNNKRYFVVVQNIEKKKPKQTRAKKGHYFR